MSHAVDSIKRRHMKLCELRKSGLTTQNADEHYEKDVRDLLRINDALMKTCCQMNIKMNEALKIPIRPFKVYWDTFDLAIDKLITNRLPAKIIKPN